MQARRRTSDRRPTDDRRRDRAARLRADAQRNVDALLEAAKTVFDTSGVDAPAKEIADLAGVGVGTLYRHFPQRSDLVKAVFQREIDACADAGPGAERRARAGRGTRASGCAGTPSSSRPNGDSPRPCTRAIRRSTPCPATSCSSSDPPSGHCSTPRQPAGEIRDDVSAQGPAARRRQPVPAGAGRGRRVQPAHGRAAHRRAALRRRPGLKYVSTGCRGSSLQDS